MKIKGKTGLDRLEGISAELRVMLRSQWVENVEEFVALLAAAPPAVAAGALSAGVEAVEQKRARAAGLLGTQAGALLSPKPGGPLGCRVRPGAAQLFAAQGRLGTPRSQPPLGFARDLPPAVRLLDGFRPIKDQGERGTCVAFAAAALREFIDEAALGYSEQFLYWACKQLDGQPGPGTYLHTAMTALHEYGVCLERDWPYDPAQDDHNEGQGPPPPNCLLEAKAHRLLNARPVQPNLPEHFKQALAGDADGPGLPVVAGLLVFDSWYRSAETHRTGKLTLPFPGEPPVGGHAMCVAGYVDDVEVPGGGYFILRNSWGQEWAAQSPEAPGYALAPYAYVERYALEAFTGPVRERTTAAQGKSEDPRFRSYIGRISPGASPSQCRDMEGKLLAPGTAILAHPLAPHEFMEDDAILANRARFADQDYTWTPATRQRVWFPERDQIPPVLAGQWESVAGLKQAFLGALDENMRQSVRHPFPEVYAPKWYRWVPYEWEPRIRHVSAVVELTEALAKALQAGDLTGVPDGREGVSWPEEWRRRLAAMNALKVYSVDGSMAKVHVVVAFVNGLKFQREEAPALAEFAQGWVAAVEKTYQDWLEHQRQERPSFVFYTIGTAANLPAGASALATSGHWVILSCPAAGKRWSDRMPPRISDRKSFRDFSELLLPETRRERMAWLKVCVDDLLDTDGGHVSVDKVARKTGYRRSVVREAFLQLQLQGPDDYRLYRTSDGVWAIRHPKKGEAIKITAALYPRRFIRRHALGMMSVTVGVVVSMASMPLKGWIEKKLGFPGYTVTLIGILIAYVGSILQTAINRRADKDKED